MEKNNSMNKNLEKACALVKKRIGEIPEIAIVLGSGLGRIAEKLEDRITI